MKHKLLRINKGLLFILLSLPWACGFANTDVSNVANILTQNLDYSANIMETVSVLGGVVLLFVAIYDFRKYGLHGGAAGSGNVTLLSPIVKIVCASALLAMSSVVNSALFAFWGNASPETNPFMNSSDPWTQFYEPVMMGVRLIGLGVFFRMIVTFAQGAGSNPKPGSIGKALVYLPTSVCLIHIQTFLAFVLYFFGFNPPSF